jgi:hypothetical protein
MFLTTFTLLVLIGNLWFHGYLIPVPYYQNLDMLNDYTKDTRTFVMQNACSAVKMTLARESCPINISERSLSMNYTSFDGEIDSLKDFMGPLLEDVERYVTQLATGTWVGFYSIVNGFEVGLLAVSAGVCLFAAMAMINNPTSRVAMKSNTIATVLTRLCIFACILIDLTLKFRSLNGMFNSVYYIAYQVVFYILIVLARRIDTRYLPHGSSLQQQDPPEKTFTKMESGWGFRAPTAVVSEGVKQ